MSQHYNGVCERWEVAIAKRLVNRFQNKLPLLRREGFEDLLQECLIYWLAEKGGYDPTKGASQKTFMGKVVQRHLQHISEKIHAKKRKSFYEAHSLDEYIDETEDSSSATKKHEPFVLDDPAVHLDLLSVFKRLTPEQIEICVMLRDGNASIHSVSKCLKKHHSHIHREVIRIRQIFENEGLRKFLS